MINKETIYEKKLKYNHDIGHLIKLPVKNGNKWVRISCLMLRMYILSFLIYRSKDFPSFYISHYFFIMWRKMGHLHTDFSENIYFMVDVLKFRKTYDGLLNKQ